MNRGRNMVWKLSAIVAVFLMGLGTAGMGFAQDTPAQDTLSLKGPRLLFISKPGDYSIRVLNSGDKIKKNTRVVVSLPQNVQYMEASVKGDVRSSKGDAPASVSWPLGDMEPGKQMDLKFRVMPVKTGSISIDAEYTDSTQAKPITVSTATRIMGVPNISMGCYDTEDPVQVGKNTTYVLEVLNDGSSVASSINLEYRIPEQMTFVSARVTSGLSYKVEGNVVKFTTYPLLNPGKKITYRIECRVVEKGLAKTKAILTYDQWEGELIDEEGTSCY